jgi:hypothetical protein
MTLTREEVLRMAREAEINVYDASEFGEDSIVIIGNSGISLNSLRKLIQLGIAEGERREREECAKVCDKLAERNFNWGGENADRYHIQADWAELCASAIRARTRARGETKHENKNT